MTDDRIFWGETHHNTYQMCEQDPPLAAVLEEAARYLDFYTAAYYTAVFDPVPLRPELVLPEGMPKGGHPVEQAAGGRRTWQGIRLEHLKDRGAMEREWNEVQEATRRWNEPGEFVAFPGYEWQGNARWGDHNVIYRTEGSPLHTPQTLPELYAALGPLDALAIPHHTGYLTGRRAPVWTACDERRSPFVEIFSIHGSSETDEEWIGMRHNSHMGPGAGGSTYQDALDAGLHLGAVCSTDNWKNVPGRWGHGLAACLATDLSRDALWDAFLARRVYGVTGDRIRLDFRCNDMRMGEILDWTPRRSLHVAVEGLDAIDRIEILRNGRVMTTHCHQGTWRFPGPGQRSRFKLRVEAGWGPRSGEVPCPEKLWDGMLQIAGGRMLGWSPCWIARGQGVPVLDRDRAVFSLRSLQENTAEPMQGATLFEFESDPDAAVDISLNGMRLQASLRSLGQQSRVLWDRDASARLLGDATGLDPAQVPRDDVYYLFAHKVKVHRLAPQAAYCASLDIVDEEPLTGETHYRVRVEQRNGQRAWSSPIWVRDRSDRRPAVADQ